MITKLTLSLLCSSLILLGSTVQAAEGMVTIYQPQDGAVLDPFDDNAIRYKVEPGPAGDHVHLYENGHETAVIRRLEGSYPLRALNLGQQELCLKVVNRAHVPTGPESCIKVMVR